LRAPASDYRLLPDGAGPDHKKGCAGAYDQLCRVRNSLRHARLAEFPHHAITALESDQREGAKYILLTALATFGWRSDYTDGL